jgi:hypothetical protein
LCGSRAQISGYEAAAENKASEAYETSKDIAADAKKTATKTATATVRALAPSEMCICACE